MATYIVTFEVTDASRKSNLVEKIKKYGNYCAIHDNCWAIVSNQDPEQVRDSLGEVLTMSDRILVIRSGTHAAWRTYGSEHSKWLKERL